VIWVSQLDWNRDVRASRQGSWLYFPQSFNLRSKASGGSLLSYFLMHLWPTINIKINCYLIG